MMKTMTGATAQINIGALKHNFIELKKTLAADVKIAAVVKADAYGHGIQKVSQVFMELGAEYLAVSSIREAMMIRQFHKTCPLFVMGYTDNHDLKWGVENQITLTIFSREQALLLSEYATGISKEAKVKIHIKIDTGFHRLGYDDEKLAVKEIKEMSFLPGLEIEGIFSHLALKDEQSDVLQYDKFEKLIEELEKNHIQIPIRHICDSIGAIAYPKWHMNMVRVGALLYGYCSRKTSFALKPAMSFQTKVTRVGKIQKGDGVSYDYTYVADSERIIATLCAGYGDGMPRNLSNKGYVVIHGQRAPIIGIICMDQCMVDVTHISHVTPGDDAYIFGGRAEKVMPLLEVAKISQTNRNELLCRITARVPRIYIESGGNKA